MKKLILSMLLIVTLIGCTPQEFPFTVSRNEYCSYNELSTNQQMMCVTRDTTFIYYSENIDKVKKKFFNLGKSL